MAKLFFDVDSRDIILLKGQWDNLISSYTSNITIRDDVFQLLKDKYTEPNRIYHNLNHVKTMLNLLDSLNTKPQEPNAIRFSIWFHDVIYNSQRNDNEEESAKLASQMMRQLQVNSKTIYFVRGLILATKEHSGKDLPDSAKLFLDIDLAILGASEEIYKEYSKAIREEYSWVSASVYREGRKKVLESFIERDIIYFTEEIQTRYEQQARNNINSEIKSLNQK
jgi:predicted metal-dependent HD superfamily phosphohydrolase